MPKRAVSSSQSGKKPKAQRKAPKRKSSPPSAASKAGPGVWPFAVGGVLIVTSTGRSNHLWSMSTETVRLVLLDTLEAALEAQLREVREMRLSMQQKLPAKMALKFRRSLSQTEMALEVVQSASKPLHLNEIIKAIEERFAISVDRESLGSALTKRAVRADRFVRAGKNTFGLLPTS